MAKKRAQSKKEKQQKTIQWLMGEYDCKEFSELLTLSESDPILHRLLREAGHVFSATDSVKVSEPSNETIQESLSDVFWAINSVAQRNASEIEIEFEMSEAQTKYLESLGFTVKNYMNEYYTHVHMCHISW